MRTAYECSHLGASVLRSVGPMCMSSPPNVPRWAQVSLHSMREHRLCQHHRCSRNDQWRQGTHRAIANGSNCVGHNTKGRHALRDMREEPGRLTRPAIDRCNTSQPPPPPSGGLLLPWLLAGGRICRRYLVNRVLSEQPGLCQIGSPARGRGRETELLKGLCEAGTARKSVGARLVRL